ncbi:MAG TPA: CDP-glycerol glycerophosphotransferase family protein [Candidatus Olsenella pullicola]|nr:CDP-glycerol glycerophosphotransferase family protein [Candidatus Olsenella pullicola]
MFDVSVIVPVYNGEKTVREALNALLGQTLGDRLQIVVVDDGSTDSSFEIISSFAEHYPTRIQALHIENSGAAHARNVGLEHAEGEYVGFLDCDDSADTAMFQKLLELARSEESDIATCGYLRVEGDDVQRRDYTRRPCFGYPLVQAPSLIRRNVPYIWNKLFRRDFLLENELRFDETLRIYEDLLFTYTAFACANKVVRVHETLYVYNFARENSLTVDFSEKRLDIVPAFTKLVEAYQRRGLFLHVEEELLRCFLTHFYVVLENSSLDSLKSSEAKLFTSECFDFLDECFPWWRHFDVFFKQTKRPQALYGNRLFIRALLNAPKGSRFRLLKQRKARRRWAGRSRAGRVFVETMQTQEIDQTKVILDSQRGDNLNGNMFYLLRYFLEEERSLEWTICVTYRTAASRRAFVALINASGLDLSRIKLQKYNGVTYAQNLATARLVFTDTSLPVYYLKRAGQTYLNTWHGTPLKCLGRDMEEGFAGTANLTKNFMAADYLAFQSPYMSECMKSAYMYDGFTHATTLLEGYPRNEPFADPSRVSDEVREAFLSLEGEAGDGPSDLQRIAYLPTWRGSAATNVAEKTDVAELLREIDERLDDHQVMYVKLHPYDGSRVSFASYRHVRPFPKCGETYAVLSLCDVLVTDYSSVFFDFAVTGKPIVLYTYDREEYLRERGLYLDFDDLGLPCANTAEELVELLSSCGERSEEAAALAGRFSPYESSSCSRRLVGACLGQERGLRAEVPAAPVENATVLFCGDLRSSLTARAVRSMLDEVPASETLCLTYDVNVSCNLSLLKDVDRSVRLFGRSYPLTATTQKERTLLADVELSPSLSERHIDELCGIARREAQRSWPNVSFERAIVYGPDSLNNLILATCVADSCVLAFDTIHDPSLIEHIPRWLLNRFSTIVLPQNCGIPEGITAQVRHWRGAEKDGLSALLA